MRDGPRLLVGVIVVMIPDLELAVHGRQFTSRGAQRVT